MKIYQLFALFMVSCMLLTSCVTSSKKYKEQAAELLKTKNDLNDCQTAVAKGVIANKKLDKEVADLQNQIDEAKAQLYGTVDAADSMVSSSLRRGTGSGQLLNTLRDINYLNSDQVSSINQSLASISTGGVGGKALINTMIANLKSAMGVENDPDVNIQSDKGYLYIDLNERVFFNSGSADLTAHAKVIIEKVSRILKANPDIHFMIEGHTDSRPISGGCASDNWELSTRRANAVVRVLQHQYKIDPTIMLSAGHAEYDPLQPNDSEQNRAQNRRISIVMTPQIDQFLKLLVK